MPVHVSLNTGSRTCVHVFVSVCVCWPCPVSPLLFNEESHLSKEDCSGLSFKMFFKETHHYTGFRRRPASVKPRPSSTLLFFFLILFFFFLLLALVFICERVWTRGQKCDPFLQGDSGDDTSLGRPNRHVRLKSDRGTNENVRCQLWWALTSPWLPRRRFALRPGSWSN